MRALAAFAALIPREEAQSDPARNRFGSIACAHGLSPIRLGGGVLMAVTEPAIIGADTAVVGPVYATSGERPPDRAILQCLRHGADRNRPGERWWGNFVVATVTGRSTVIERAAFGALPCFWMDLGSHVLATSSPALLEALAPTRPTPDWRELAIYLLSPQMRRAATCLQGVNELPGGSALEIGPNGHTVIPQWSPWDHACGPGAIDCHQSAAERMRAVIDATLAASCRGLRDPVLLLSGGMDSSTIAAALHNAGSSFSAVTMITRHKSGDERAYAQAVAQATGIPLVECFRSLEDIDWDDTTPARLARPSARVFRQPTLAAASRLAAETGGDTILDGGGGDDLFCALQSVVPLLDRIAVEGPRSGAWTTARDIALRTGATLPAVLAKAIRRKATGRIAFRWPTDAAFLTGDAQLLVSRAVRHPWLDPPPGAMPGQAAHVALVLDAVGLAEDDSTDPGLRTFSPLVAQPIVEAALGIRSWLWFENGRSRSVIRRAYADSLPTSVIERTGKGTPMGFIGEIVESNHARLRALLLDGLLVERGIADAREIEAALRPDMLAREKRCAQLLILADAERWARLWS